MNEAKLEEAFAVLARRWTPADAERVLQVTCDTHDEELKLAQLRTDALLARNEQLLRIVRVISVVMAALSLTYMAIVLGLHFA